MVTTERAVQRWCAVTGAIVTLLSPAHVVRAEQISADVGTTGAGVEGERGGAVLVAGKVGGVAEFNGLSPFVAGGVEIGYAFGSSRSLAVLLDAEYTQPSTEGDARENYDPQRVSDGRYSFELVQKQLALQPTLLLRLTGVLDALTPYAGVGPRVYLLETVVRGEAGGETFPDTTEQSMKFGAGIPLGVEIALGPGGILAELLFQWAPLDHETTGDSHLGGLNVFIGYRALL